MKKNRTLNLSYLGLRLDDDNDDDEDSQNYWRQVTMCVIEDSRVYKFICNGMWAYYTLRKRIKRKSGMAQQAGFSPYVLLPLAVLSFSLCNPNPSYVTYESGPS